MNSRETHMNNVLKVWSVFANDLIVGDSYLEQIHHWCRTQMQIELNVLSGDEALSRAVSDSDQPDLILINSGRRGEFSREMLLLVIAKFPLAQLLEITGEWCIGDSRSGDPLPIACRFGVGIVFRRLRSMLSSRQQFLKMRSFVRPLARVSELTSSGIQYNSTMGNSSLILVASCKCEGNAMQKLLQHEGYIVHLHSSWNSIATGSPQLPVVFCIANRRELIAMQREEIGSPRLIIASHYNRADECLLLGDGSAVFLRKPFFSHDLTNAIDSIGEVAKANAA